MQEIARKRDCHILMTHHSRKGKTRGMDQILGSTALHGCVDTALLIDCWRNTRSLSTSQRYEKDLSPMQLVMGQGYALSIRQENDELYQEIWQRIEPAVNEHPNCSRDELLKIVRIRKKSLYAALKWTMEQTPALLIRTGEGKKGSPYRYSLPTGTVYRELAEQKHGLGGKLLI